MKKTAVILCGMCCDLEKCRVFLDISSQLGRPMSDEKIDEKRNDPAAAGGPAPVVQARELFGDCREIVIEHDGERYKLRITRRGKLILQK